MAPNEIIAGILLSLITKSTYHEVDILPFLLPQSSTYILAQVETKLAFQTTLAYKRTQAIVCSNRPQDRVVLIGLFKTT